MKLRSFYTIFCLFIACNIASASDNVHVMALTEFKTEAPSKNINVQVVEASVLGSTQLQKDDVIHCSVTKTISPKRGKRAASFYVTPISYTSGENTITIKEKYSGKYSERIISKEELKNVDAAKVGKKAAITVGNHFVKGIAPVASLAEGMIKNEEGNRIESGVKQVYKDSFLSYASKGKDLVIEPGQQFYLIFKPATNNDTEEFNDDSEE